MTKKKASRSSKKKGKGASGGTKNALEAEDIYGRYKECTSDFWEWMKRALPGSKMISVNDLSRGVDQILENSVQVLNSDKPMESLQVQPVVAPKNIINRLTSSIKLREQFSRFYADQPDTGHEHMISTLIYCKEVLLFSRRVIQVAFNDSREQEENSEVNKSSGVGGRFSAFLGEDDEEGVDEQITDDDIRSHKFPSFQPPTEAERELSIQDDLINGDDRFQAIALLQSMEELMGLVVMHFYVLKSCMRGEMELSGTRVQTVMECAMVTNLATESVLSIERAMAVDRPHLDSFYRVLALAFLPSQVAEVHKQIPAETLAHAPHLALYFVGDVVECCFRNRSDIRVLRKVGEYIKRSGIRRATLEELAEQVVAATENEVVPAHEEKQRPDAIPHSLFAQSPHIGGYRSILNTHNEVQILRDVTEDGTEFFASLFVSSNENENKPMTWKVRGDPDGGLVMNILPELVALLRNNPFPDVPELSLLTVAKLLATQFEHQNAPIPIALTFGLHAVLTSMYIVQGEGHLSKIEQALKRSFNKLFVQLEVRSDREREPKNSPNFYHNVNNSKQNVKMTTYGGPPDSKYNHAIWNPVIGGGYLLFATYIGSVKLGSNNVDSMAQLRIALHLYNALKQQGLVSEKDAPLLEGLDKSFEECRAVWAGLRPEKGAYARQFSMAASQTSLQAHYAQPGRNLQRGRMASRRPPELILPEQFSASYKLVVQRDFKEWVFKEWNAKKAADFRIRCEYKTDDGRELLTSPFDPGNIVNMVRDSMAEDREWVLPINFTEVGCILLEFCNVLSKEPGWESAVEEVIPRIPKAKGFGGSDCNIRHEALLFCIGRLFEDLDNREAIEMTMARTAAACMTSFFKGIPKSKYTFIVDVEDGGPELQDLPL